MDDMIQLYQAGGSGDFTLLQDGPSHEQCRLIFRNAARLLAARSQTEAAELLRTIPFQIVEATNHFNDEFSVLHAVVPLAEYERLRQEALDMETRAAFRQVGEVLTELGTFIRFIAVELALEPLSHPEAQRGSGLTKSEINKLVHKYLGVSVGYLADFTYRSHHEFYMDLDLDINPNQYDGTTRERFIKILGESAPHVQAKILEGVLERFPVGSAEIRTEARAEKIRKWITRLRTGRQVEQPNLRITSEVVERALRDVEELLRATGATSGVDRIHTALHGYMREACSSAGLVAGDDAALTELFKIIREGHAAFTDIGPRSTEVVRVLRALANIVDTLNPLRNKASVAHPNPVLLPEPEAMLVINAARSILHYVDEKIYRHEGNGAKSESGKSL
jgi:hypothetical protein